MRYNSDHSINIVMEDSNLHNIVNRRINRDRNVRGDFTCYTPRECSVVDYFISSEYLMNYISDMSVYGPSEHSYISLSNHFVHHTASTKHSFHANHHKKL